MGYHHLDPDEVDPSPDHVCDRRALSEEAGLTLLHMARYTLDPGEDLARTYHYHEQREEAFYVVSGTLHVETPEGEYAVDAGETFLVERESPIRPYNPADADEPAVVVGTGAPKTDPAHPYEPEE